MHSDASASSLPTHVADKCILPESDSRETPEHAYTVDGHVIDEIIDRMVNR